MAPVVAEQGTTEGHLFRHEIALEGDGCDVIQQGRHFGDFCKESFDRCIDTATSGFFLLVEDAQEGLEEIGGIFDLRFLWILCFLLTGKGQQIVNIGLEG